MIPGENETDYHSTSLNWGTRTDSPPEAGIQGTTDMMILQGEGENVDLLDQAPPESHDLGSFGNLPQIQILGLRN